MGSRRRIFGSVGVGACKWMSGMQIPAHPQQEEVMWRYFSGLMKAVAHGTKKLARVQRREDVWKC